MRRMRADEGSRSPRWRLTVWFERSGEPTTFDFDVEPNYSAGPEVASFHGKREGRSVRVNVTIDRATARRLAEIAR